MDIKNTTKKSIPKIPLNKIKKFALGEKYELSLVFIGNKLSCRLNKDYKKNNRPTNVLAFPLSKNSGEIFINLNLAKKQAAQFGKKYNNFVGFLFIHALLHLKGYEHSSKMEREERRIGKKFNI